MKFYQLLVGLLGLILLVCLCGVEGQYMPTSTGNVTTSNIPSVGYSATTQNLKINQTANPYSQYYTMGPAPDTHITAPQQFNISGNIPSTVYFSYQRQPVVYSQYQSTPSKINNSLWLKGSNSWAQYAEVPQGAVVPLLAISPNGGSGNIREIHPNGQVYNYNYFFYPYSQLTFYADTIGRHTIDFGLLDQPSNQVVIDVIGTYKPPSYFNPPSMIIPTKSTLQNQSTAISPTKINASQKVTSKYSEYYRNLTGPKPSARVSAPVKYNISNNPPYSVYFAQRQAMPYSILKSNPTYENNNSLWIKGTTSWTQYAAVPFGTLVSLIAVSPNGGRGYFTDIEPNGLKYSQNFFFYPDNQQTFYADEIGRHTLTFTTGNRVSNPVVIDVIRYPYLVANWGDPYFNYFYGFPSDYLALEEGESAIQAAEGQPEFGAGADKSSTTSEARAGEAAIVAGGENS